MFKKLLSLFAVLSFALLAVAGCATKGEAPTVSSFLEENREALEMVMNLSMGSELGEGGTVKLEAGGENELIYIFQFGPGFIEEDMAEMITPLLEAGLESQAAVFEEMANDTKAEIGIDSLDLTIVYTDSEGNRLASKTFKSN